MFINLAVSEKAELTCYFVTNFIFCFVGIGVVDVSIFIIIVIHIVIGDFLLFWFWLVKRLYFLNLGCCKCGETFAFCLITFHADKVSYFYFLRFLMSFRLISYADTRIDFMSKQNEATVCVLAKYAVMLVTVFQLKTFQVGVIIVVGIQKNSAPYGVSIVFADIIQIRYLIIVYIKICGVKIAVV